MTPRVLVVSATAAEAAHVPAGLPLVVTGMGKVAAATATARALSSYDDHAGLTVVTRNARDFDGLGVPVLNPWY